MPHLSLKKSRETRPHPLLSLTELGSLRLRVQDVERVRVALLLQVVLNLAELLAELAVQYLVVQNVLEVLPGSSTVQSESSAQLAILRDRRVVLEL